MTKVNIVRVLDGRFECAHCHDSRRWVPTGRALVRQYSSIHRLRCGHCAERIVAKVVGGRYSSEAARVHARHEYEALCTLQFTFPQDERYGTLVPLGYLEYAGCGVVITSLAAGVDLMHYLRTLDASGIQMACRSAGIWLRKLHDSDVQNRQAYLGAADKVSFLADTYGDVLRYDSKTGSAYELFIGNSPGVDTAVAAVRQHGDFKPDNMLCDGTMCIGLDIGWCAVGAAVYDLAPFLDHLWLDAGAVARAHGGHIYDLAETEFLAGYGHTVDMRALRWTQLYFALCYMGEYRQRGRVTASYANWKTWPLVRRLAMQVREGA